MISQSQEETMMDARSQDQSGREREERMVSVWRGDLPKHRIRKVYQQYGEHLSSAMRMTWPQTDAILNGLARLLFSDLPTAFDARHTIFDASVAFMFDCFERHGAHRDFIPEIVFGVTDKVLGILDYTVCYLGKQHIQKRWEPLETTIYDLANLYPVERLTLVDVPHPMRRHRDAGIILASRVFSIRDMLASGMLQGSST